MSMNKVIIKIIFFSIVLFSCNEQRTTPVGRYELLLDLTEKNMSLQDREELTTSLVSENPLFLFALLDTNLSWKDLLPSELIIQDSIIEFIDVDGVSSGKAAYTYKKVNDTTAKFVLETGEAFDFVSQKDYYILKMENLNLYFSKIKESN